MGDFFSFVRVVGSVVISLRFFVRPTNILDTKGDTIASAKMS